jgi:hypothetical protein
VRIRISTPRWNKALQNTSPGGAAKLSPALQRGVEWDDDASPRGTTDVLTHRL